MKSLISKCTVLLIVFLLGSIESGAQTELAAFKDDNGMWGYMNKKGEIVIPAIFSHVKAFSSDGYALAKEKKSKEFNYYSTSGNKLELSVRPDKYGNFSDGRAMVRIGEFWGYIDTKGEIIIQPKYSRATDFYEGVALAQDAGGKAYLINKTGGETDLSGLGITLVKDFTEGLAPVEVNEGNWGYLDTDGKLAIPARFLKVGYFSAGLAWARQNEENDVIIDKNGKVIIDKGYVAIKDFDPVSGIVRVKNVDGQWLYVDKQGVELKVDATKFGDFSEGLCSVDESSNPGVYGFIGKDGSWVIEPRFENTGDFHNGICRVRMNKLWGVIDKSGKFIIEPKLKGLHDFAKIE